MFITLNPTNSQKSFYGKAVYTVERNDDSYTYTLYSYGTRILSITSYNSHPEKLYFDRIWSGYSATTMKHINSFIDTVCIIRNIPDNNYGGKKWWDSLPIAHYA